MIQPLQFNSAVSFKSQKSSALDEKLKNANSNLQNEVAALGQEAEKKFSVVETYNKGKKGVVSFFKGLNNVTGVTGGVAMGVVEGAMATAVMGVIGKAVSGARKETGLKVLGTIIGDSIGDFAKGIWNTVKFIPSIITKSPLENIKTVASLPAKFYTNYLKGNKVVATAATAIGLGVLAFRAVQGKINANKKNADLDHKTNLGHV